MKNILSLIAAAAVTVASMSTFAKDSSSSSSSSKIGPFTWFGLGSGSVKVTDPSTGAKFTTSYVADTGVEYGYVLGLGLSVGVNGSLSSGTINYNYTSPIDSTNFTQTNANFSTFAYTIEAGIVWRLINQPNFHFYIKAGGSLGAETLSYNVSDTSLNTADENYETSQSSVPIGGYWGEAGFDIMPTPNVGIRLTAREYKLKSGQVDAFNKQTISTQPFYGMISFVKTMGN